MAAASCHQQTEGPGAVLGEDATMPSPYIETTARSTKTDRGVISSSPPRVPAEAAHCRTRQPRPSPNSGAVLVAGSVHLPRSQSDSNLRLGLVPRRLIGRDLRSKTCRPRHPCERPVCAFSRKLAGSAPGTGLFAHRTGFHAPGKG